MPRVITPEAAKEKAALLGLDFPFTEDDVRRLSPALSKHKVEVHKLLRYLRYSNK